MTLNQVVITQKTEDYQHAQWMFQKSMETFISVFIFVCLRRKHVWLKKTIKSDILNQTRLLHEANVESETEPDSFCHKLRLKRIELLYFYFYKKVRNVNFFAVFLSLLTLWSQSLMMMIVRIHNFISCLHF